MTDYTYVAITNIPNEYHTADLRAHFSSFVEAGSFICFHFRHRPEKVVNANSEQHNNDNSSKEHTTKPRFSCVVVKLLSSKLNDFTQRFDNEPWTDASNNYSKYCCNISSLKLSRSSTCVDSSNCIDEDKLLAMPEMKPPDLMPNGNVGTPTSVFFNFIQRCLLPDRLIHTLKLKFPKMEGKRIYSNVNFNYPENDQDIDRLHKRKEIKLQSKCKFYPRTSHRVTAASSSSLDNNTGEINVKNSFNVNMNVEKKTTKRELKKLRKVERKETLALMSENIEERLIGIDKKYCNDEDAEEWDRHEACEDDPSNQERNKERLYEEEIEQPWEKGGPGVVFYTDAIYWQSQEGDFDEQTTDDLDVDFSPYEGDGPGDKDIKDFLKIRQERRFRSGYDKTDRFSIGLSSKPVSNVNQSSERLFRKPDARIGQFEIHTRGIGRKIIENFGWADGEGLGKTQSGIKQALKSDGQKPHVKKGLGFVEGESSKYGSSMIKRRKLSKSRLITTTYDNPDVTDPKELLLERHEPTTLKHRKSFVDKFQLEK